MNKSRLTSVEDYKGITIELGDIVGFCDDIENPGSIIVGKLINIEYIRNKSVKLAALKTENYGVLHIHSNFLINMEWVENNYPEYIL